MWVMFLVMNWHGNFEYKATTAIPVTVTSQEFLSKQTCDNAVKVAKQSKKTYDAWCVKK